MCHKRTIPVLLVMSILGAGCAAGATAPSAIDQRTPAPASSPTPSQHPSPSPSASAVLSPSASLAGKATLSADRCAYTSAIAALPEGLVSFEVVNETAEFSGFDLLRVSDGSTFEDVIAHIAVENDRADSGLAPAGFPSSAEHLGQQGLDPGMAGSISVVARQGTYGIVCIVRAGEDPLRFYLVGPLEVSAT